MAQSSLDPLRGLIFLLILLSLSRIHVHLGIGGIRPTLILAVGTAAFATMNPRLVNGEKLLRYWPARTFAALFLLACASAAFGISLGGSAVFIVETFSKVIVLAFIVVAGVRRAGDLRVMIWAYVVSCGILAYYSIFVFKLRVVNTGMARLNELYTFDSNDIGVILLSGVPLALLLFQTSRGPRKLVAAAVLLGTGITIARSGSRGGFLALVAVGLALLLWVPGVKAAKRVLFVGTLGIGLGLAAPHGYWEQMGTLFSPKEDYNWDDHYGRRMTAQRGIGYMMRYPVFGVGIGQFQRADGTLSDRAVNFVESIGHANRWRAAHNSFVEAGAEMGIPGLLLWSSLIVGGIVSMRRLRRRLPRGWLHGDPDRRLIYYMTIYLPVSLIGFAVGAFWVSFAWLDPLYILAAFVTGVHLSFAALEPNAAPPSAMPRSGQARVPATTPGRRIGA